MKKREKRNKVIFKKGKEQFHKKIELDLSEKTAIGIVEKPE